MAAGKKTVLGDPPPPWNFVGVNGGGDLKAEKRLQASCQLAAGLDPFTLGGGVPSALWKALNTTTPLETRIGVGESREGGVWIGRRRIEGIEGNAQPMISPLRDWRLEIHKTGNQR